MVDDVPGEQKLPTLPPDILKKLVINNSGVTIIYACVLNNLEALAVATVVKFGDEYERFTIAPVPPKFCM